MTYFDEKAAVEWIRRKLEETGSRQEDLARAWGKGGTENPGNYVSKTLAGGRKLQLQEFFIAKEFFGESIVDAPIPVVGKVGAGGHIHGVDSGVIDEVENFGGYYPNGTKGVEVEGVSMGEDIPDGSIIFYQDEYEVPQVFHINQRCVVWTHDGRSMVKKLLRGSRPDRWSLYSYGTGTTEEDVVLDRVAKVTGVKYR